MRRSHQARPIDPSDHTGVVIRTQLARDFPFDIALAASNLSERVGLVAALPAIGAAASLPLSEFDRWKIERQSRRLAEQLAEEPPSRLGVNPSQADIRAVLASYRRWETTDLPLNDAEREVVWDVHGAWLPTYRDALTGFDVSSTLSDRYFWRRPELFYGRFARACEPFLIHITDRLDAACADANRDAGIEMLTPAIVDDFVTQFLDRFDLALAWVIEADVNVHCARLSIDKAATTPADHLAYFDGTFSSAGDYHRFYRRFPVLGRWLAGVAASTCRNGRTVMRRLRADLAGLGPTLFGDAIAGVDRLKLGKSDYHAGGQSVALVDVRLAGGRSAGLVYKPRGVESEAGMQQMLSRLNAAGVMSFGTHKVIAKDGYGYEELIPSGTNTVESVPAAESIYEELGGYLGLFHVLGGGDLHYENILVAAPHAHVCDCETVLGIRVAGQDRPLGTVLDSVYKTGLLEWPKAFGDAGGSAMMMSGYAGGESYSLPVPVPRVNDERMSLALGVTHQSDVRIDPDAGNRVYVADQLVSPADFKDAIVRGFSRIHEWFEGSRATAGQWLAELFATAPVRHVNWATQIYLQLLVAARHPKCLMDPLEVDTVFNALRQGPRKWDPDRSLALEEVASLWQLDVPIFTARASSTELCHGHGVHVAIRLEAPPLQDALDRIDSLTRQNYRHQVQYIAASLAVDEVHSDDFVATAIEYARRVGHKLCSLLDDPASGSVWRSYQIGSPGYRETDILADLYNGTAGVSLFLGYLDSLSPHDAFRTGAQQALTHALRNHSRDRVGAFQGLGGMVYVLTHLWHLWQDDSLLDRALVLTKEIGEQIPKDREFDVLSGAAGVIPVMLGLAEATGGQGVDLAQSCGRHLLINADQDNTGLSWPLARPSEAIANLTGFAHGSSGIGWALIKLGCFSGDTDYVAAGREAFRYEEQYFDDDKQDWYDLRTSVIAMAQGRRTFSNGWCNGAAGIGLSRISSWSMLGGEEEELLHEAYLGLSATLRNFRRLGNDSLCHGRSGNAELFLRFGLLRDEPAFQLEANVQAQAQWQNIEEDQSMVIGADDVRVFPGLMLGLAGFGLHFLRLAHPDRIPSPLLLDPFPLSA